MRELALFAGAGGGILGGLLLGWRTVCAVELDEFCRNVLVQRQNDRSLAPFPIWGDVCTFDGKPWRGHVDVISGGFPCQGISAAGTRKGLDDPRSGLWREFARIIGDVQAPWAFIENSPHLRTRGLVTVLKDLDRLGYDAAWGVLGASDVGAPHVRKRMWIVARRRSDAPSERHDAPAWGSRASEPPALEATTDHSGKREQSFDAEVAGAQDVCDAGGAPVRNEQVAREKGQGAAVIRARNWWPASVTEGVVDGVANRMDRVRATGNGQVPGVAALAWRTLSPLLERKS